SLNYFATQVWFESPYHIYNSSATDTTEANSCCFEDTLFAGLFHGLIDLADGQQLADCRVNFYWPKSFGGSAPVPLEYTMLQNYPNPFNPTTTIAYSIPEACDVKIRIYNILGQVVTTLVDEYKTPGEYAVVWDGNDADGRPVASGMYFCQMRAGQYMSSKKMLMLK
ncbi:MAG: FlgD immunoglobulin-like domain containing protein, partial [candidate division Zixibacteria bacterium]|nr:FlgD immunoglobulin-like domain containing protein [candidate division Zixibacteria bacterium]